MARTITDQEFAIAEEYFDEMFLAQQIQDFEDTWCDAEDNLCGQLPTQ